ncbi:MAG TPA: malto-oligosyltrehalose synthase [Gemmatimonadaceae bacterium]
MTRHPLSATYRVQLNKQFTLNDAREIVPYLDRLGISHLYCSPILAARPGSMHGYDVIDPTRVNPEIGTVDDLRALAAALHERGMGVMLDIVPNHMGIGAVNPYWDEVLAHGVHSRYARWFDIDWAAADNKVVLPVLGDELDKIIDRDELALDVTEKTPRLRYGDRSWPIDPATMPDELQVVKLDPTSVADPSSVLRGAEGRQRLRRMLDAQHYRLTFWRRGPSEINYRRFFDVNDLAALRQEDPEVFAATHDLVLDLVAEGTLDGLRIDHVDGLLDPLGYLERLRAEVERRADGGTFPIVVEKILSPGEKLRRGWPVQGTTGYEFLNDLEEVFLDPDGYAALERGYRSLRRLTSDSFSDIAHAGKVKILEGPLGADVSRLTRLLRPFVHGSAVEGTLRAGIVQFIAALPVYRTYVDGRSPKPDADDAAVVTRTLEIAHHRAGSDQTPTVDLIGDVVLGQNSDPECAERLGFVQRLQQTSGPAAAKGVEDTALYVYLPLSSRNEVGGAPDRPLDDAVGRLHKGSAERACSWPLGLTCTNTHDTKRSADVRARLDVLSECAPEWQRCVARWRRLNQRHRTTVKGRLAPDTNTEYLLYQTLIGLWPSPRSGRRIDDLPDRSWLESARQRVEQYMLKAVKEAKTRTSWTEPDEGYENALKQFIAAILSGGEDSAFLGDIARFVGRIATAGHWNALARVVLQLTSPGVADTYQGDELWLFALVDPDNRRPVDYKRRQELLATVSAPGALHALEPWDERLKLGVVQRLLNMRRDRASLFTGGGYLPLQVQGSLARHVVAFARTSGTDRAIVVAPRLMQSATPRNSARPDWQDTALLLPEPLRGGSFRSVLGDGEVRLVEASTTLALGALLSNLPMAVLLSL